MPFQVRLLSNSGKLQAVIVQFGYSFIRLLTGRKCGHEQ